MGDDLKKIAEIDIATNKKATVTADQNTHLNDKKTGDGALDANNNVVEINNTTHTDASAITSAFSDSGNTGKLFLVNATKMGADQLNAVITGITGGATVTINGDLHLVHALSDGIKHSVHNTLDKNFHLLLTAYKGASVTADATDMGLAELRAIIANAHWGKIKANGITNKLEFKAEDTAYLSSTESSKLLQKVDDSTDVIMVATGYNSSGIQKVGLLPKIEKITDLDSSHDFSATAAQISGKTITGTGTGGKITITYMHQKLDADLSKIGTETGGNINVIAQTNNSGDITFNGKLGVATFNITGTSQVTMETGAEFNN